MQAKQVVISKEDDNSSNLQKVASGQLMTEMAREEGTRMQAERKIVRKTYPPGED